jgi:hypothetical protein
MLQVRRASNRMNQKVPLASAGLFCDVIPLRDERCARDGESRTQQSADVLRLTATISVAIDTSFIEVKDRESGLLN